jgi:hypothetical protein
VLKDAADTLTGRVTANEADIADRYTKQQAVQKFAYLEEAEGNTVQILDTVEAPFAELKILGETVATPTDPLQEVSPDNPQTLDSLGGFDITTNNVDESETITKTITLKDTSDNQLEARGIPLTYNPDGSVATWLAQDRIVKVDGVWGLEGNVKKYSYTVPLLLYQQTYFGEDYSMGYFQFLDRSYSSSKNILCNILPTKDFTTGVTTAIIGRTADPNYTYIRVPISLTGVLTTDTTAEAIVKLRAYLLAKGMYIYYETNSPTFTPLCTADQTALNEIEAQGTFDGTTNIMLSTEVGKVSVEGAKDITKVISDMASAIALLG